MGGYYPNNVSGNNYENKYYEGENGIEIYENS
jgi:hypothetical protein